MKHATQSAPVLPHSGGILRPALVVFAALSLSLIHI